MRLSVVVIAFNEERDLPDCLKSVQPLLPELIVLDSGSNDRTIDTARVLGAKVESRRFDDYASQKQAAVDLASGDLILSLDADERASPELLSEIKTILDGKDPGVNGWDIPFQVVFQGKVLRFGGLGSESHLRLFRKGKGRFGGQHLHEGISADGPVARMKGSIRHEPYRDFNDYLSKLGPYTSRAAEKRFSAGKRFSPFHHCLPVWEFFMRTILKGGILDGFAGISWAALSAFHSWLKYAKLRELERGPQ